MYVYQLMLGYALLSGELAAAAQFAEWSNPRFVAIFLFSCSQAFVINLATFMCTKTNSPLTTSVTGQLSKIVTLGLGMVLFAEHKRGGETTSIANVLGLLIGLAGGLIYAYVRYHEGVRRRWIDEEARKLQSRHRRSESFIEL